MVKKKKRIKFTQKGSTFIVLEKFRPTFKYIGDFMKKLACLKVGFCFPPGNLFGIICQGTSLEHFC